MGEVEVFQIHMKNVIVIGDFNRIGVALAVRPCFGAVAYLYFFLDRQDILFLKEHFKDDTGLLMKPERTQGIDYLGDDWKKYKDRYFPKRDATPKEIEHLIAFAKLISKADDDTFAKQVGNYLDIDNFLRFIAVTTMLPNTDSFLTTGHNFHMYLNPRTNKLAFMPWDLDIAFCGFPIMGTIDQQTNWNLAKPGRVRLVNRLLAIPDMDERYRKVVIEIAGVAFTRQKLLGEIDAMEKLLAEPLAKEKQAKDARKEKVDKFGTWVAGFFEPQPPIRTFVEKRLKMVMLVGVLLVLSGFLVLR